MNARLPDPPSFRFGAFRLDTALGILFFETEPTELGRRATALLGTLLRHAGEPVTRAVLIDSAWPGLVVEDSNLSVQIAAIRRVLATHAHGDEWIETLPRRGYRYRGPAVVRADAPDPPDAAVGSAEAGRPPSPLPSIAVLAFTNLSADPSRAYFADGMVEDITAGLARIKGLVVTARRSAFAFRDQAADARRIGRELGVRYLLQGSVRTDGTRVRITVRLVEAESGDHLWSERYDGSLDDVFALQDDIALSTVGAIEPRLRRAEAARVARKRPESLDAYDLVLRSQSDVDSGMPDRVSAALRLLERALALDPAYALAHAYAAMCHHCLYLRAGLHEAHRHASLDHARMAIEHGQDDALALTFAGFSIGMDGHDRAGAFAAFDAALAISPSAALAYVFGSVILGWGGMADRAIAWSERGRRLSPFDPWRFAALHGSALGHFQAGRYEASAADAQAAVHGNPGHSISYMLLAAALVRLGRIEPALAAAAKLLELQPTFRASRQFRGVDCEPALARALGESLQRLGLPA